MVNISAVLTLWDMKTPATHGTGKNYNAKGINAAASSVIWAISLSIPLLITTAYNNLRDFQ